MGADVAISVVLLGNEYRGVVVVIGMGSWAWLEVFSREHQKWLFIYVLGVVWNSNMLSRSWRSGGRALSGPHPDTATSACTHRQKGFFGGLKRLKKQSDIQFMASIDGSWADTLASRFLHNTNPPTATLRQFRTGCVSSSSTHHHRTSFAFSSCPLSSYALASAYHASE